MYGSSDAGAPSARWSLLRQARCATATIMLKRLALGLLFGVSGYVAAAIAGYFLIMGFSSNTHDRLLEAGMTSAFVLGPAGAVLGFAVGFILRGRRRAKAGEND